MKTDTYDGPMSEMRDSPWLASEDLENPDGPGYIEKVMTINCIVEVRDAQFKGGRTKAKGFAVKFHETERMLYLNAINRDVLKAVHGRNAPDVVGKKIVVYVDPYVKLMGEVKPGLRLKEHIAPVAKQAALSPADQKAITDAKKQIAEAADVATLKGIGALIGKQSSAVKEGVRKVYEARLAELK